MTLSRRSFLGVSSALGATGLLPAFRPQDPGERPAHAEGVRVLNPRSRVPVGLIVDDSTCLVNLAHFAVPQFRSIFPDRYSQDWRSFPREIPNSFVRKFAFWARENGVRGKWSVIPYPACVGWLDRELPGWTRAELDESLRTLRDDLAPNWDFQPEMVSHTWVINPKNGRPDPERSERFMENWGWSRGRSADEFAEYLAYALRALKNAGLPCEGVTSPGGFGSGALEAYARGVLESCRDVFRVEVPNYVKHGREGDPSVAPRVHYASGIGGPDPKCVVQILAGTGDWFGGWDGITAGSVDKFITADGRQGRMVDVIRREEPALMLGHWPGFYGNGDEHGFIILKEVVRRLREHFDNLVWMKVSEVARYWAARELTGIGRTERDLCFTAPLACPAFTLEVAAPPGMRPNLREVARPLDLESGTWARTDRGFIACVDLPKGVSRLEVREGKP